MNMQRLLRLFIEVSYRREASGLQGAVRACHHPRSGAALESSGAVTFTEFIDVVVCLPDSSDGYFPDTALAPTG